MSPWTEFVALAAKTTIKGAAFTLTSTVASCTMACYIEIGAHRLVYRYFPEKYANVEHANGITQAELDAVRRFKTSDINIKSSEDIIRYDEASNFKQEDRTEYDNVRTKDLEATSILEAHVPMKDIMTCAMTG